MRTKSIFVVAGLLLAFQTARSQQTAYKNVQLSSRFPQQGQDLEVSYKALDNSPPNKEIIATVCFYQSTHYPAPTPVKMEGANGTYVVRLHVPDSARVLVMAFAGDTSMDSNHKKGYLLPIYKDKTQAKNVAGIEAFIFTYGDEAAGIEPDQELGLKLVNQQLQAYPDTKEDFMNIRYLCMAHSKSEQVKKQLEKELNALLQSNNERDWLKASNGYAYLKNQGKIDSLYKLEMERFPDGITARSNDISNFFITKGASEMEQAYISWLKRFPPENFGPDRLQYDYAIVALGKNFAREKDSIKALAYADSIKTIYYKSVAWDEIAQELFRSGLYESAKKLYIKAIDTGYTYLTTKKGDVYAPKATANFLASCTNYAILLYEQGRYADALKYVQLAYSFYKKAYELNYYYAKILMANDQYTFAYTLLDEIMQTGKAKEEQTAVFKKVYIKEKGSDAGLDDYLTGIKQRIAAANHDDLVKHMLNKPAPLFSLIDLDGRPVSLESLRGKTVVLDFWATWCGPCKKSFPAMKKTQDKYKADPNVKFLFIHTWETSATAANDARAYLTEQKYDFEVLMDMKDPATKKNEVVESYGVKGIPAKFVIDRNGNIRFQLTGFKGDTDEAVDELSTMIELARSR